MKIQKQQWMICKRDYDNLSPMEDKKDKIENVFNVPDTAAIDRRDDAQFQYEIKKLIETAEETRISFMNKHQSQKMLTTSLNMLAILIGSAGFAWFLLMEVALVEAIASLIIAVTVPLLLRSWAAKPLQNYEKHYKTRYLPALGDLMGGFSYHPTKGINEKVVRKTGVMPQYASYKSEDCFRGVYKGSKVMFSEAKLKDDKNISVFNGLFVLVEIPNAVFEGHTIITGDREMAGHYESTRWRKLQKMSLTVSNKLWDRFVAYSDNPQAAELVLGESLIKELAEVDIAFGDANISTVLFRGKYIFMMIPHEADMFEACDLYLPISTQKHALACKKEIDQILEMIDVFNLLGSQSGP